jgi:hypothetical protein
VVAFQGYGKVRASNNHIVQTIRNEVPNKSLSIVLLKCLTKGINMVEEDFSDEHPDGDSSNDEAFIPSFLNHTAVGCCISFSFKAIRHVSKQHPLLKIFTPPDVLTS